MGRLARKIAVVSGSTSGLGQAIAGTFGAEGAHVVCLSRSRDRAEDEAATIRSAGGEATAVACDVTSEDDVDRMTAHVLDSLRRVDVVVACAGTASPGKAAETTTSEWQRAIRENAESKWLTFRGFLPGMAERGEGSVVVISSISAAIGIPGSFPYAAAQGACLAMVRQAAVDYAPHRVRFNSILPATVPTPLVVQAYERGGGLVPGRDAQDGLRRAAELFPLGRLGRADEVAAIALHLAGDESAWTTGQQFVVDGGYTMR